MPWTRAELLMVQGIPVMLRGPLACLLTGKSSRQLRGNVSRNDKPSVMQSEQDCSGVTKGKTPAEPSASHPSTSSWMLLRMERKRILLYEHLVGNNFFYCFSIKSCHNSTNPLTITNLTLPPGNSRQETLSACQGILWYNSLSSTSALYVII